MLFHTSDVYLRELLEPPPKPSGFPPDDTYPSGIIEPPYPAPSNDPTMTDPENETQEDEDQACALEFDLPLPTFRPEPTESIKPPPAPPSPSPEPPTNPPAPNPDTEKVTCFDKGTPVSRGQFLGVTDPNCALYDGTVLDDSQKNTQRTITNIQGDENGSCEFLGDCKLLVLNKITVKNNCRFTMTENDCRRKFRRIIDECDKEATGQKQGGIMEDNCSTWYADPTWKVVDGNAVEE